MKNQAGICMTWVYRGVVFKILKNSQSWALHQKLQDTGHCIGAVYLKLHPELHFSPLDFGSLGISADF